jgi:hypothetical protein
MTSTAQTTQQDAAPVDIATIRETIGRFLPSDVEQPTGDELATLTALMRGQIALIIPEVRALAVKLPKDDVPRYCALACIGDAEGRLRERPNPAPGGANAFARRLARALNALADHYENLATPQH